MIQQNIILTGYKYPMLNIIQYEKEMENNSTAA